MKNSPITTPAHLSESSKQLWQTFVPSRITAPAQLTLLEQALITLDRLNQIRKQLAKSDLITTTKKTGVHRINPLVVAEAKVRDQFIQLWWRLGFQNDQPGYECR